MKYLLIFSLFILNTTLLAVEEKSTAKTPQQLVNPSDIHEGWVRVKFDIAETGDVVHAEIIEANPSWLFDHMAMKEIYQIKFQPVYKNGKAIKRQGVIMKMDFTQAKLAEKPIPMKP